MLLFAKSVSQKLICIYAFTYRERPLLLTESYVNAALNASENRLFILLIAVEGLLWFDRLWLTDEGKC